MERILVVDDDERLGALVVELLRRNAYEAEAAISASQARSKLHEAHFDAILVDWMMPVENGIAFIRSLRASASHLQNIPAIMLTAVDDVDKKVIGFEAGYDDYITKPFEAKELIARLRALIKRTTTAMGNIAEVLRFGNCEFDTKNDELRCSGELVHLSTTELSLLKTLCQRPNQPFSRCDLARKLAFQVSGRTIDVQITRLRKKIGDNQKQPTIIRTIRYVGYAIYCE